MSVFTASELSTLRKAVEKIKVDPYVLHDPDLGFLKDCLVALGAKLPPPKEKTNKSSEPKPEEKMEEEPEEVEEEDPDSEVELDMEGVIAGDTDPPQEMGDPSKTELTEADEDKFSESRSAALQHFSEGEWQQAIDKFTEAIQVNANASMAFAKRGACYLKLKKPNACIRDCTRAIELNPDSAPAYKARGRAHRLLGHFMEAAKDLRVACKIDFDEQADEWLREVTPNAKKLEEHERKKARKQAERELKAKEERIRKAREAREKAAKEQEEQGGGGEPGGLPDDLKSMLNDPELLSAMKDPETSAAFFDIMQNPANILKYQGNPKVMALAAKMAEKMGGGMPGGMMGGMGGMPGGMGGMPGGMGGMPGGMGGMPGGMGGGMGGMQGGMGGMPGGASSAPKPPPTADDLD